MPFQFLISSTGDSIAAARVPFASARHPTGGAASTDRAGRIWLDTLPECILPQIVERLQEGAIVSLSRTSRRMHAQLDRDFVAPIRLAERLTWLVSNSAFQRALGDIAQLSSAHRRCALLMRMSVDQLHPAIRERAEAARRALLPVDAAMPQPGSRWTVLNRPPGPYAGALDDRIGLAPRDETTQGMAPAGLFGVASSLEAQARDRALTDPIRQVFGDRVGWRDLLEGMLTLARKLRPQTDPAALSQRAALLTSVAKGLAGLSRHDMRAVCRSPFWTLAFDEASALPPAMQPPIWAELAKSAAYDFAAALERYMPAESRETRWYRLIGVACKHMPAAQASEALLAMLDTVDELAEVTSTPAPYIALMDAASRLPDTLAVAVVTRGLEQASRMDSTENYVQIWEAVFGASLELDAALQQQVLVVLGKRLPGSDGRTERWLLLSDRVAALPRALWCEPLLALIDLELSMDVGAEVAVPRMLAFAGELDIGDRAELLSALIQVYDDDPCHWPDMVNAAVDLPLRMRRKPLAAIAHKLLVPRMSPAGEQRQSTEDTQAGAPGEVWLAAWPASEREARCQFTELLGMLTWADRGFVMLNIAPFAAVSRFTWLIEEGLRLPRSGRWEVRLFTTLAERATRLTDPQDAARILPALADAVRTLRPDQCASALYWLRDACERANMLDVCAPALEHFRALLPAEDAPAHGAKRLKRKASDRHADLERP